MKDRIKQIREQVEDKKLSQTAFGERIGLTRDNVANIEGGRVEPTEIVIRSICREFNVSELWLRKGEGEMFSDIPIEEEIAAFAKSILDFGSESFQVRFIHALSKLTPEGWAILEGIAKDMQKEH